MAYEELFTDLLKAESEEDVTDALTVFGLEKFSDSNWLPYGGIENNYGIIGAQQADAIGALVEKVVETGALAFETQPSLSEMRAGGCVSKVNLACAVSWS